MTIRKLFLTCFTIIILTLSLLSITSPHTIAQEPDSPPAKGPDPILAATATPPPPPQIDPALRVKIEPQLLKKLLGAENGQIVPFIAYLKMQADLPGALASAELGAQQQLDPVARRTVVVNTLQQTAQSSQAGVLQLLQASSAGGGLSGQSIATTDINPLWVVNAVAAKGSLETVLALAARADVDIVRLDKEIKLSRPPATLDFGLPILDCDGFKCQPFIQRARPDMQSTAWGVSKIRADLVHNALGIDGAGVVVANIDTGVDWLHPALQANYRGYTGSGHLPLHAGNWFDATGGGATYPVDGNGHGTHTMGTMVGGAGIGVAPGAKWIAVRTFDSSGSAQSSWLHSAFQWILAPNGDPALAPHIVNNSWGSNNGFSTEFQADVQALLNAGIYPVFSAGNNGPGGSTVGSPGSLNNAFAVGATTIDDEIAWFSSRGPSPWGVIKPDVSAPGKDVPSSIPGGVYTEFDGTSMAAPHAAGLAALLIQASPSLTTNVGNISNIMKSTAVDLGTPGPDNNFGSGRIDAYNAVISVAAVGALQGAVTDAGSPIANANLQIVPTLGGPTVNASTNSSGNYLQGLAPDTYTVTASAFGYQPATAPLVNVMTNATTIQNFSLTPQATGVLAGTVKDKNTLAPLAATVSIDNTPANTATNPTNGSYTLQLPVGVYTATVIAAQHRITQAVNINISAGTTTTLNFLLETAPSILLVDSGKWYQESQATFYQQALTDQLYPYELWQVDTPSDVPSAAALSAYDIVIWSSPYDSPGYIGADDELTAYLNGGGKLLLSGQDVAYYDGFWFWQVSYLKNVLKTTFVQDNSGINSVSGVAGEPFAATSFSIAGGDGADNQTSPDVIANANSDFAAPLLAYDADNLAGLHVDLCAPYRALFFSFGFEAINSRAGRSQVMGQVVDWLLQSSAPVGVELTPLQETKVGAFGATVSQTIRVRNTGSSSDTIALTISNGAPYNWPVSGVPSSVTLGSCQSQQLTANVQLPAAQTWHISDTFTLTAQSGNDLTMTAVATRTTKTPAPVLLVDDDRWYSFTNELKAGLEANNIPYDYYLVAKSWSGPEPPSPPLATLQMYPILVWYTAYDWANTLTPAEETKLAAYLDGGGRLFFSGQDFLYNHLNNHSGSYQSFAQNYLGVLAHTEDYSSTLTIGQADNPVGAYLGPYNLSFPPGYNNWTDALTPTTTAKAVTLGQVGQVNGLTNAGVGPGGQAWHTNFLAYGPELLDTADRARLMQRSVGWLSWLGSSTIEAAAPSAANGSLITYTATISNSGWSPISTATFTATFPAYLNPVSASAGVNLVGGKFVWNGSLGVNESKSFTYTAQINASLPPGTVISQTNWLFYPEHNILFDRLADVGVKPDLSASSISVTPNQNIVLNDALNYTIILRNDGLADSPQVTTVDPLPPTLELLSIGTPGSGAVISNTNIFTWTTALAQGQISTLNVQARVKSAGGFTIVNTASVNDSFNPVFNISAGASFKTLPTYLPLIMKN
jgi:uncharacterized repeat protein (TIGR01451 family)